MERKNVIIAVLIIALGVTLCLFLIDGEFSGIKNDVVSLSGVDGVISSSQPLRVAFDQASQHSAIADIAELSCFPSSRYNCDLEGCTPSAPATYYFLDYGSDSGTYFRCDLKGCDSYPVKVVTSGSHVQFVSSQGEAMLFKVVSDDSLSNRGEFVDIATIGPAAFVSFGKCETPE